MASGIYRILCLPNNKIYIGSATTFSQRFSRHRRDLRLGQHCSPALQNAWNKYGEDQFVFEILEAVEPQDLIRIEQTYIDKFRASDSNFGFNIAPFAGSPRGTKRPHLHALNRARVGKKLSSAHRAAISLSRIGNKYRLGTCQSPETIEKIKSALRGRSFTPEHRANISKAQLMRQERNRQEMKGK